MNRPIPGALLSLYNWLRETLVLQLLLTAAVIPLLLCWKLAYTPMSILGNLLHPLFLLPFLALSSILFFATLLGLPTQFLCQLLTHLHTAWLYVLHIPLPTMWLSVNGLYLIPALLTCFTIWRTVHGRSTTPHGKLLIRLTCATAVGLVFLQWTLPTPAKTFLERGTKTVSFTLTKEKTLVIRDHGYLSGAANSDAIIDYEVMPHIVSTYGTPKKIVFRTHKKGMRIRRCIEILREWGFVVTCQNYARLH